MPRPSTRHLPPKSQTPTPNKHCPEPWCTQYIEELKEHLAAEKQIAFAHADEVVEATIRANPQILERHLAVEATVNASRADATMRLAALNKCSWSFLEVFVVSFDEDYKKKKKNKKKKREEEEEEKEKEKKKKKKEEEEEEKKREEKEEKKNKKKKKEEEEEEEEKKKKKKEKEEEDNNNKKKKRRTRRRRKRMNTILLLF
ncbi:hypothetical protein D1007_10349 [Hordeum vulgare]|nr:hypothetical protein D1007_10349 [Hordeum vulgare]